MNKKDNDPSIETGPMPAQLPALRKRPAQSRSRALVSAVEQACLKILDEEGEETLTIARISEVSGVAVGSIYQYFPNKDAIITLLYERVLDEESEQLLSMRERLVGLSLESALRKIFANIIRVETRLFKLNKAFHLRYHSALHLGMWRGSYHTTREFIDATWLPLLKMYEHEIGAAGSAAGSVSARAGNARCDPVGARGCSAAAGKPCVGGQPGRHGGRLSEPYGKGLTKGCPLPRQRPGIARALWRTRLRLHPERHLRRAVYRAVDIVESPIRCAY